MAAARAGLAVAAGYRLAAAAASPWTSRSEPAPVPIGGKDPPMVEAEKVNPRNPIVS